MSDRREMPSNGRVAHVSLRGKVAAERFVEGERRRVVAARASLRDAPDGERDRELNFGEEFIALDTQRSRAFGFCARDGMVGWVHEGGLADPVRATHKIRVPRSYAKQVPELKRTTDDIMPLSFGSPLCVVAAHGPWRRIDTGEGFPCWVPGSHLCEIGSLWTDPVAVARKFLGTPYLWGGNSAFGIDCSGLVQAAMLACGLPCPGDSDQQAARLGNEIGAEAPRRRGDLWFWEGHVGMLSDADTLLHANAHHMAVVEEPLDDAVARIGAKEGRDVLCRRRVTPPGG